MGVIRMDGVGELTADLGRHLGKELVFWAFYRFNVNGGNQDF